MASDPFATSHGIGIVATVDLPSDEELSKALKEALLKDSKVNLRPIKIEVDCDYAMPLEYGTGPYGDTSVNAPGASRTGGRICGNPSLKGIPYSAILKWTYDSKTVARKYGLRTKGDHESFAFHVAKRIKEEGMLAHPFFRPGVYNVLDRLPKDYFDDYSHSLRTIGEDMVEEMKRILEENESIATEELYNSISVSYVTSDDAIYAHTSLEMSKTDELWQMEEDLDIHRGMSRESIDVSLDGNRAKSGYSVKSRLDNAKAPDQSRVWRGAAKRRNPNYKIHVGQKPKGGSRRRRSKK